MPLPFAARAALGGWFAAALWLAPAPPADAPPRSAPAAPPVRLYVPNQMSSTISVLDGAGTLLATVDLHGLGFSAHAMPHQVAAAPDGSAWYVTLAGDGYVLEFDRDNRLAAKTKVAVPGMIVLDPRRDRLYVSRALNAVDPPASLAVLRASDLELLDEPETLAPRPHALAVDTVSGRVYTASLSVNQIVTYDPASGEASVTELAGPPHGFVGLGTSPDGRRLVATTQITNQLLAFETADPRRLKQIAAVGLEPGPYDVTFSPDGRSVWIPNQQADCVTQVDAGGWTVSAVIRGRGFAEPHGVVLTPDSRTVYVSSHGRVLEPAHPADTMAGMRHDMESARARGTVVAIDVATRSIRSVTEVGRYAAALGISGAP